LLAKEDPMTVGGSKEVGGLTREEWIAYRELAEEALQAWDHGEATHVSGTTQADLAELVLYCGAQVQRLDEGDEGLEAVGIRWPMRSLMRAMAPAAQARLKGHEGL
jgi:hypothetical protein